MKELTLKEAAELLNCSEQTVRRRIKSGQLRARREVINSGIRWMIPESDVVTANKVVDVVTVRKQVELEDIRQAIRNEVAEVVREETNVMQNQIAELKSQMDKQTEALDGHYQLVDQRLRQLIEKKAEPEQPRSFWKRLFG